MNVKTVAVVFGTRPEAVKLAPVVAELRRHPDLRVRVVATAQHREMLDQALAVFGVAPDVDLDLMRPGQTLPDLTARLVTALANTFEAERPDAVLVQGDTTTAFAGALAAFYAHVPVGHVEAGLRSGVPDDPFPEEANRRLVGVLADLHFAPTPRAANNLRREGVPEARILVTGNTVIDALLGVLRALPSAPAPNGRRRLLMTMHRRENWGGPIREVCVAVREVLEARPDVELLFPVHRNPLVREEVGGVLAGHPRVELAEPLDYGELVRAMRDCTLVLTDSGGIQEEAPTLGKPVLVLRRTTERPEAVEAGCARLVGTERAAVRGELMRLLDEPAAYAAMAHVANPFGDGRASERVALALRQRLGLVGH
ncbi:MAG TPA: UDP-N-acetylglucosamine 2-epimerase (non-hydrolyzing) [Chloroflexota bacterium]|nr:UDP-N-acetylglucosamine 2-epimerase (non-hydrolyzing) [Chloroflexota bacterium]